MSMCLFVTNDSLDCPCLILNNRVCQHRYMIVSQGEGEGEGEGRGGEGRVRGGGEGRELGRE